jgi:uncharacterized protein YabN with tetrapyrrole methylase and pyrophosphatase domain
VKLFALVGTGIKTISHITEEAKGYISSCDLVLYLINEPVLESYIKRLAKASEPLNTIYFNSDSRENSYKEIARYAQSKMENVESLCLVIYGHPCIFATPGLLALEKLSEQVKTVVCPGISAMDCLYADLRFDPSQGGVQLVDATELIIYEKYLDIFSHTVIYQIGMVGNLGLPTNKKNEKALIFLKNKLLRLFNSDKKALIYEAALYPGVDPKIIEFNLSDLDKQELTTLSTLYIPPVEHAQRKACADALELLTIGIEED